MTDQMTESQVRDSQRNSSLGGLVHVVRLACKDAEHAGRCLDALTHYGRPDALAFGCLDYQFGFEVGSRDTIRLVERWANWADLDALLTEKVVPALPLYNELLATPFDPATDTLRIELGRSGDGRDQ